MSNIVNRNDEMDKSTETSTMLLTIVFKDRE